ncbi:TPA: hypothetical protein DDZ10_00405 [Candidatus Uhrbacteria bacterium]|nr:hypothetical protein [Candidatus Uhrbacteria bacterium]
MSDLLADLNDAQREAVTHRGGPLMIVAGAGTGKTTVITRRIAWLIEQGLAKSSEILALTFTEKAAGEMEERVDRLLPMGYLDLSVHTFHAFCERVLREHGMEIGLARDFRILTEIDAWLLARSRFDAFRLDHYRPLGNPTRHLRDLLRHFASLKEEGVWPEDYRTFVEALNPSPEGVNENNRLKELARAYATYEAILHEANALDFGGLILYTLKLFKERPVVLETLRRRYRHILVDEFQDTNTSQYELVKLLAEPERNLTVVGDDDQSIYRFRGASIANILVFDEQYPDAKHVVLTTNYRSHQEILDAAYGFIQHNNPARLEVKTGLLKKLSAQKKTGGFVEHVHYGSLEEEARGVLDAILEARKKDPTLAWKDVGILVRANDHAAPFVELFETRGVPYQFLAMRGLYVKPVVLDMTAWLCIINNPFDSVSVYRVLSHPMWKMETRDLERLSHAAVKQGKSLLGLNLDLIEDLGSSGREIMERIQGIRNELADLARRKRAAEMLILAARQSGLVEWVSALPEVQAKDDFALLQQFYVRIRNFEARNDEKSLRSFLEEFAHEREAGETGALDFDMETGPDTIRVMTVHASKGLEFRHVFIVNLVDRRFPSQHRKEAIPVPDELIPSMASGEHLEEERRLFYVAMTRAKERLFLTSAEDYGGARKKKFSRFLQELDLQTASETTRAPVSVFQEAPNQTLVPSHGREAIVLELPKHFSFTQYRAYRACPLQYKFAHLFKIPVMSKDTMSFGKTLHTTLQIFFERWIKEGVLPAEETLYDLYRASWIDEWYLNDEAREAYRNRGRASLAKVYEELKINPPKPLAVEQAFTLKLGSAIIKGQIDRVDEIEGGLHLIDYKAGAPKTLEKLGTEQKDQLYIYQLAAEEIWKKPVRRLTYQYLLDNSNVSFLGSENDLAKVRERIKEAVAGIKEGHFDPTPGFHCGTCDFKDICPFRAL